MAERVFLSDTPFSDRGDAYTVRVTDSGVIVESECCGDIMTREVALKLYHAIGDYFVATQPKESKDG